MAVGATLKSCGVAGMIALCPLIATAQASGEFVTGLSYSSLYGATGLADLSIANIADSGADLSLRFRAGDEGQGGALGFSGRVDAPGLQVDVVYSLGAAVDDWDFRATSQRIYRASIGLEAPLGEGASYRASVFWNQVRLEDLEAGSSPIIAADIGTETAYGVGLGLNWTTRDEEDRLSPGISLRSALRVSLADAPRNWAEASVGADATTRFVGPSLLNMAIEGGAIHSLDGDADRIAIYDRVFLGGTEPRGFSFGGLGPRDATTDDALGGTRYVTGTVEVLTPLPNSAVSIGVFGDFGAVWDLPGSSAPAIVGDEFSLRSSVGLSLNWENRLGRLVISVAEPIEAESFDDTRALSFSLEATF